MSDVKQILILRTKYPDGKGGFKNVRKGKLVAQGAHSSLKVFFAQLEEAGDDCLELGPREAWDWHGAVLPWIQGLFTKVAVYVESEEELRALYQKAQDAGLPCSLIEDSGLTEFHGEKTATAVAIGPSKAEDLDPITGTLPLL